MTQQTPQPVEQQPTVFEDDPQVAKTLSEDPLFRFLGRNWRVLLVLVGLVLLGYFFNNMFHATYVETMQRSAEVFENVHAQYAEIESSKKQLLQLQLESAKLAKDQNADAKQKEENQKKVTELDAKISASTTKLEALIAALADTREPYNKLALIYRALLFKSKNDLKAAADTLQGLNWKSIDMQNKQRFFAELAGFNLAGVLLDSSENSAQGQTLLKDLALSSEYLSGAAALRISALASSPEQRSEAGSIIEQVLAKHPEHSDLLDPELKRLQ